MNKKIIDEAARKNVLFNHRMVNRTLSGKELAEFGEQNFKDGIDWFKENLWHTSESLPKVGEVIICIHKKGKFLGILQEDKWTILTVPGSLVYDFYSTIRWCYLNDIYKVK